MSALFAEVGAELLAMGEGLEGIGAELHAPSKELANKMLKEID